jgi:hypothetical protein
MFQLNPASLDSIESIQLNDKKNKNNNKTSKNRVSFSDNNNDSLPLKNKINNLSKLIHENNEDENDNNNFQQATINNKNVNEFLSNDVTKNELNKMLINSDNNITNGLYNNSNVKNVYSNLDDSYTNNLDFIKNMPSSNSDLLNNNNKLLSKLDYIIHLLEEQHNEKTNHITEELILYLFLGIFIIFVLDSFAKASKYVR